MTNKQKFYRKCHTWFILCLMLIIIFLAWFVSNTNNPTIKISWINTFLPLTGIILSFIGAIFALILGTGEYKPKKPKPPLLIGWPTNTWYRISYIQHGYQVHQYTETFASIGPLLLALKEENIPSVEITWRKEDE